MSKKKFLWFPVILLFLQACQNKNEESLALREEELSQKEQQFALKEADYQSLLKMRDSLNNTVKQDSVAPPKVWPPEIAGTWTGKVVCTESNCSDYVIGDQRTDNWVFVSDSTQMAVKIVNNNKIVRIYNSEYTNNEIKMNFKTDSTSVKKVEMNVLLDDITPNKIRGTRTVTSDKNCVAKFSVELVRPSK